MKPSAQRIVARLKKHWMSSFQLIVQFGTQAGRRVRELRADGYDVRKKRVYRYGKATSTWLYKIIR